MVLECQGNFFKRLGHFLELFQEFLKKFLAIKSEKNCLKNRIKSRMIL